MIVTPTELPEVLVVEPRVARDPRGYFMEAWSAERYAAHGIDTPFVQDNVSYSARGVLRGLHLQHPGGQGKLVSVLRGEVLDVAVDVRSGSPRFGQWVAVSLSATNGRQLYVPPGFAHGFVVAGAEALVHYKVTAPHRPDAELAIRWDDPALGIAWPLALPPLLSARDATAPCLAEVPIERLPPYDGGPSPAERGVASRAPAGP